VFHYYVCVHSAWKGHLRNHLYCVGWDVKPFHSLGMCLSVASVHLSVCAGLVCNRSWSVYVRSTSGACWRANQH